MAGAARAGLYGVGGKELPVNRLPVLGALAAISVVYYHTCCTPHFGTFSVDLFLVLSGFAAPLVGVGQIAAREVAAILGD